MSGGEVVACSLLSDSNPNEKYANARKEFLSEVENLLQEHGQALERSDYQTGQSAGSRVIMSCIAVGPVANAVRRLSEKLTPQEDRDLAIVVFHPRAPHDQRVPSSSQQMKAPKTCDKIVDVVFDRTTGRIFASATNKQAAKEVSFHLGRLGSCPSAVSLSADLRRTSLPVSREHQSRDTDLILVLTFDEVESWLSTQQQDSSILQLQKDVSAVRHQSEDTKKQSAVKEEKIKQQSQNIAKLKTVKTNLCSKYNLSHATQGIECFVLSDSNPSEKYANARNDFLKSVEYQVEQQGKVLKATPYPAETPPGHQAVILSCIAVGPVANSVKRTLEKLTPNAADPCLAIVVFHPRAQHDQRVGSSRHQVKAPKPSNVIVDVVFDRTTGKIFNSEKNKDAAKEVSIYLANVAVSL